MIYLEDKWCEPEINDLLGETFISATTSDREILFHTEDGQVVKMLHQQDCCEDVYIEDICGDIDDIVGSPITLAEETKQEDPGADESGTWTFYKLGTARGGVTIRWYGQSNGYYSETASLELVREREEY